MTLPLLTDLLYWMNGDLSECMVYRAQIDHVNRNGSIKLRLPMFWTDHKVNQCGRTVVRNRRMGQQWKTHSEEFEARVR